jgi:hypothetical protein
MLPKYGLPLPIASSFDLKYTGKRLKEDLYRQANENQKAVGETGSYRQLRPLLVQWKPRARRGFQGRIMLPRYGVQPTTSNCSRPDSA